MSRSHTVQLFLKNILDDDYKETVIFLRGRENCTLKDCIANIRKRERHILQEKKTSRKLSTRQRRKKIRRGRQRRARRTAAKHMSLSASDSDDDQVGSTYLQFPTKSRARRLQGEWLFEVRSAGVQ